MQTAAMARMTELASMYRHQMAEVDSELEKARNLANNLNAKQSAKMKKSKSSKNGPNPKQKKATNKSKKATIVSREREGSGYYSGPAKQSITKKKDSFVRQVQEMENWKEIYAQKIAAQLEQIYRPYVEKLTELEKTIEILEKERVCLEEITVRRVFEEDGLKPVIMDYVELNEYLKKQLASLTQDTQDNQALKEINHLRLVLSEKEEFLKQQGGSTQIRSDMLKEQDELKGLAQELQVAETKRAELYKTIEELKNQIDGPASQNHPYKLQLNQKTEETASRAIEMKQKNTNLALQGRVTENRLDELQALEENLQRYHDHFQLCTNDPAYSTESLYTDYLSFLTETYEDFLLKLVDEEETYLADQIQYQKDPAEADSRNRHSMD